MYGEALSSHTRSTSTFRMCHSGDWVFVILPRCFFGVENIVVSFTPTGVAVCFSRCHMINKKATYIRHPTGAFLCVSVVYNSAARQYINGLKGNAALWRKSRDDVAAIAR